MKKSNQIFQEEKHFSKLSECDFDLTKPFISVEYFPPKTEAGLQSLYHKIERIKNFRPLFVDITWGAGGSTSDLTLDLTLYCKEKVQIRPNMHLTCTNMNLEKIKDALNKCKAHGIRNILALRGDPPIEPEKVNEDSFSCALDLVHYMHNEHEDFFHISVAAYPEGHPDTIEKVFHYDSLSESEKRRCSKKRDSETGKIYYLVCRDESYKDEILYLKKKIDAGAKMIFTQMFFDVNLFIDFVSACRKEGIFVPIIPGILCFHSVEGFFRMVNFCKSRIPEKLLQSINRINEEENPDTKKSRVVNFGIEWGSSMCKQLLDYGIEGLHFYSLNQETVLLEILKNLLPILKK